MRSKSLAVFAGFVVVVAFALIAGRGEKSTTSAALETEERLTAAKPDTQPGDDQAETASNPAAEEARVIVEQLPTYPLLVCAVSGKKLGSMGDPVNFVHDRRLVRFCCAGCEDTFLKSPEKYFATIDSAVIGTQIATYPLKECPVSGGELGAMGEPHNHVYGTRLVRFCCGSCIEDFEKDPAKYLAMIDAAAADSTGAD